MTNAQMQTEIEKLKSEVDNLKKELLTQMNATHRIITLIERNARATDALCDVVAIIKSTLK